MTTNFLTSQEALEAADQLYIKMYRIRKSCFTPTHIGLGVWGKTEIDDTSASQIADITKARNSIMRQARRLKAKGY
jgi:hypothetical protein